MSTEKRKLTFHGILHALLVACGWALFVYWWNEVIPQIDGRDAALALFFIALTFIITTVVTLIWVRHNVGIFRRKGPRRSLPAVSETYRTDTLGRTIRHPGIESVRTSPVLVISVNEDGKSIEPRARA